MKKIILVSLLSLCIQAAYSQVKKSWVILYETSEDFFSNNPWRTDAIAQIRGESDTHLWIRSFTEPGTKTKIKKSMSSWALEYNGNQYFHLGYSSDANQWNVFVRFDIVGNYSVIVIDESSPNIVKNAGGTGVLGLHGVLLKESQQWGKTWVDQHGKKRKILFIDRSDIQSQLGSRNSSSHGNFLSRKQLKNLIQKSNQEIDTDDISFEGAIEIIRKLNEL